MIVAELGATLGGRKVEIVGTDIARDQLARAREGIYSQFEVQRGLPVQMLMRYFKKGRCQLAYCRNDSRYGTIPRV